MAINKNNVLLNSGTTLTKDHLISVFGAVAKETHVGDGFIASQFVMRTRVLESVKLIGKNSSQLWLTVNNVLTN